MLVAKALSGDGNERAALAVLKVVCGSDTPAVIELREQLEQIRELVAEQDRARHQEQQQQHQQTNGTPRPWRPRHVAGEDGNGSGDDTDHADGAGDTGDPGGGGAGPAGDGPAPLF
jgi:hypothetical protein